jgi:hypothetical protein
VLLMLQVPVMFIQCNGPESRTQASISISRQREAGTSTDSEDDAASPRSSSSSSAVGGGSGGFSFFNAAEAAVVVRCLDGLLLQGGLESADVCVITPYSGQVRCWKTLKPVASVLGVALCCWHMSLMRPFAGICQRCTL